LKKKVHELGIENNVVFAGYISEETLFGYYKNAIATIIPSLMEGFGLPGLEAMREDCLVLASDIPSLKEIYADSAVYFDPLAVESMHATIREVLTDKNKFHSYIKKGRERVTFFSWKKMAEQTLKIYESSISVRPYK
jgi:glycosyltransferase involved in cell wall biosynthesis